MLEARPDRLLLQRSQLRESPIPLNDSQDFSRRRHSVIVRTRQPRTGPRVLGCQRMPETQAGSKTIRATLEPFRQKGVNWVIVRLPFSVEKLWKTRGIVRVNVKVNGFNFRTAVFPTRSGRHFLVVNKKMQKAGRIAPGGTGVFTLTPDFSPRAIQLPKELEAALNEDRALRKWWDRLSASAHKWLVDPIADAKSAA